jgi:hypothetical protein
MARDILGNWDMRKGRLCRKIPRQMGCTILQGVFMTRPGSQYGNGYGVSRDLHRECILLNVLVLSRLLIGPLIVCAILVRCGDFGECMYALRKQDVMRVRHEKGKEGDMKRVKLLAEMTST